MSAASRVMVPPVPIMASAAYISDRESMAAGGTMHRRRRSAKWSGLPLVTGWPLRHRMNITSARSNNGIPRISTGLITASKLTRV